MGDQEIRCLKRATASYEWNNISLFESVPMFLKEKFSVLKKPEISAVLNVQKTHPLDLSESYNSV